MPLSLAALLSSPVLGCPHSLTLGTACLVFGRSSLLSTSVLPGRSICVLVHAGWLAFSAFLPLRVLACLFTCSPLCWLACFAAGAYVPAIHACALLSLFYLVSPLCTWLTATLASARVSASIRSSLFTRRSSP